MEDTVVKIEVRDQLTHDIGEQESKVEQLQRALDEMQRALARAEKFESDATMTIGQLEEKIDQLQQLADDRLEEMQQLAQEIDRRDERIGALKKARNVVLPTGNVILDAFAGARLNGELREALHKARGACKRLRIERDEARAELKEWRAERTGLSRDHMKLITEHAQAQHERRELLQIAATLARQLDNR